MGKTRLKIKNTEFSTNGTYTFCTVTALVNINDINSSFRNIDLYDFLSNNKKWTKIINKYNNIPGVNIDTESKTLNFIIKSKTKCSDEDDFIYNKGMKISEYVAYKKIYKIYHEFLFDISDALAEQFISIENIRRECIKYLNSADDKINDYINGAI